jgi:hypothetical protein
MACGFPTSNTGNAHEILSGPDRISAMNRKRTLLRLLTRRISEIRFAPCIVCVTNVKKDLTGFRELAHA